MGTAEELRSIGTQQGKTLEDASRQICRVQCCAALSFVTGVEEARAMNISATHYALMTPLFIAHQITF